MRQPPGKPRLSLCMIVKDEERYLARCLRSVRDVVDEIIVVDTGSTDATPMLAAGFGATVLHRPWQNDFALARNASLAQAHGDWILVLDADEELPRSTRRRLRSVMDGARCDAFQVCVRSLMPPDELQRYEDICITRLFRNRPEYRYEQPIHEQIRPVIERQGGKVREIDLVVLHYGYQQDTVQGRDRRAERNLRLLEQALATLPDDPYLLFQLGATYQTLGQPQLAEAALSRVIALNCQTLAPGTTDKLYMKLAQLALAADRYADAIHFAEASLAGNPQNVISLYVSALSHMHLGQVEDAYRHFQHIRDCRGADRSNADDLNAILNHLRQTVGKSAPVPAGPAR